ncbi:hypothetical protein B5E77_12255 [Lachnoclostridium sp. An131]|nr:hypothetical protein B5E82_00075 [Lachnoclostridium sp. An138]OUQ25073.1 hypothetical protein B5E77_12255 [Lachnoclostridium sp. An131]
MKKSDEMFVRRIIMMLAGILFISLSVGLYRLSGFGVDAFTCMNLGISGYLNMQFGTWQLIMNAVILVILFFQGREYIGAGTIVNMVFVGYGADFFCWMVQDLAHMEMSFSLRIGALVLGCLFASLGVAFYMVAEMGMSPYDSVAVLLEKLTHGKIPFQYARVCSDITVVIVGIIFCLAAGNSLWTIIGLGTICNACFNGPVIQFFRTHVSEPLLKYPKKTTGFVDRK